MSDVPGEVEVCVTLSARDVRRATLLYLRNPLLMGIFALISCSVLLNTLFTEQYTQLYAFGLICLFFFVLVPWIGAFVSMRNPVMRSPFCHTFSPLGISTQFSGGSLTLEWLHIKRALESKQYVSVYGKRGAPMLIPKGQLSGGELASLRAILNLHLRDKAKLHLSN